MKIAYFDCFAGASGDMVLGALLDAGVSLQQLQHELTKLGLSQYTLTAHKVVKNGIDGTQVRVVPSSDHSPKARHLADIKKIIDASTLAPPIKAQSTAVFTRLAKAEARVHRTDVEAVHFHEVGALDAIVDIVGGVIGLTLLGIQKVYSSPLHTGCGTVDCAHGTLPVPAPATAELIKGVPAYSTGVQGELLTPTGAALLTTLATAFGPMPAMRVETIGYGAGSADIEIPNLLRIMVGEAEDERGTNEHDSILLMETNIDDMNPQLYEHLMEKLFQQGALDVNLTPVQMKKNRPGILLSIACSPDMKERLAAIVFEETTTIGLRWRTENRITASRKIYQIDTDYGPIRVKVSQYGGQTVNVSPEYADCKRVADQKKVALKKVMESVRRAALKQLDNSS